MSMSISVWSDRTSVVLLENELHRRNLSIFGNKNELLGRLTVSDLKLPMEADPNPDFTQRIELRASELWCLNLKELRSILRKTAEKHYVGSGVKKELVEEIVREEGKRGGFGINCLSAVPPPIATYHTLPVYTQPIHTQQQQQQAQSQAQAAQQQQAYAQVQPTQQAAAVQAAQVAQAQAQQSQQPNQNQPPAQNQQQQQQQQPHQHQHQQQHQQPQAAPYISNLPRNSSEFRFAPQHQPQHQPQFRIPSPQNVPPRNSLASQHRTQLQSQRNRALLTTKSNNLKTMYEDNARDMRQAVEVLLGDVARITRDRLV
ncbi:hypothetical protein EAF00_012053 [Botryotinia globosa]|nr:hypothetical protein EAF00_012053 [Botryotinia globosa]